MTFIGQQNIFPNPNNGQFIVHSEKAQNLILFNSLGAKIETFQIEAGRNIITTSKLTKGTYLIQGEDSNLKLIIQ